MLCYCRLVNSLIFRVPCVLRSSLKPGSPYDQDRSYHSWNSVNPLRHKWLVLSVIGFNQFLLFLCPWNTVLISYILNTLLILLVVPLTYGRNALHMFVSIFFLNFLNDFLLYFCCINSFQAHLLNTLLLHKCFVSETFLALQNMLRMLASVQGDEKDWMNVHISIC